tara:strand:+ start:305 stop:1552 length:1248 start_codon:yes stop_codon:yes gene_type:complete
MENRNFLAHKYGMQGLGFDDDFMNNHTGGWSTHGDGKRTAYGPPPPVNSLHRKENEALRKPNYKVNNFEQQPVNYAVDVESSPSSTGIRDYLKASNAVSPGGVPGYLQANTSSQSAANPNGSKVGVNASKKATEALTGSASADPQGMIDMESVNNYGKTLFDNPGILENENSAANFGLRMPELEKVTDLKYAPAMPKPKLSVGQKLANSKIGKMGSKAMEMGGKAMETMSSLAGPIAMASTATGLVNRVGTAQKAVKSLKGSISSLEGVIDSTSNKEHAEEEAMFDAFTEDRRRIGARQNLALGDSLNRVRGSNLNTGSIKKIKEDIVSKYSTSTDLSLASAEDAYAAKRDDYTLQSREERAQNKLQLDELKSQLEEQEKAASPMNAIGDLVVAGVTIANPAAGMALGFAKNQIA